MSASESRVSNVPGPLDLLFFRAGVEPSGMAASSNVGAILHFRGASPDFDLLEISLREAVQKLPCLTHYISCDAGGAKWIRDCSDVGEHLSTICLDGSVDLDSIIFDLRFYKFAPDISPWKMWLISGYAKDRYVIFYLTRHDVQDAANIASVLEAIFQQGSKSRILRGAQFSPPLHWSDYMEAMDTLDVCVKTHGFWTGGPIRLSGERNVTWVRMPTAEVKAISEKWSCSINDIHLAALNFSFSSWVDAHWSHMSSNCLPILVPVNIRLESERGRPGNRFFLTRIDVSCQRRSPAECLFAILKGTARMKSRKWRMAISDIIGPTSGNLVDQFYEESSGEDKLSVVGSSFYLKNDLGLGEAIVECVDPLICCPDGFPATVAFFVYGDWSSVCFNVDEALPGVEAISVGWRDFWERI
ncbi:hypothetical protein [Burkholderia sp. ABCPW 11]|uniref:hypothetical protein n=1 Tax=Burkholderia sp. ABCPW 11 TaxID=1637859 RepID=UPI000AF67F04|nr:hypothetical protein [Burkholderia sp. ABCPW 11]